MPSLTQATMGWLSTPTILKENEGDYRYKKHPTGGGVMGGYVAMHLLEIQLLPQRNKRRIIS